MILLDYWRAWREPDETIPYRLKEPLSCSATTDQIQRLAQWIKENGEHGQIRVNRTPVGLQPGEHHVHWARNPED